MIRQDLSSELLESLEETAFTTKARGLFGLAVATVGYSVATIGGAAATRYISHEAGHSSYWDSAFDSIF
jgi:hypothetical protein